MEKDQGKLTAVEKTEEEKFADVLSGAIGTVVRELRQEEKGKPVQKDEDNYVKVLQHIPSYDPQTGKAITKPQQQMYGEQAWKNFLKSPNGMVITRYLHKPDWCETLDAYQKRMKKEAEKSAASK